MEELNTKLHKEDLRDLVVAGTCFIGTIITTLSIAFGA